MIEHYVRQRIESTAVRFRRQALDQRVFDVYLKDRPGFGERLAAGLEHPPQLRIQLILPGDHASR